MVGLGFVVYALGYWGPAENARIAEAGVCTTDTAYQPVEEIPAELQTLFVCGMVEGTTKKLVSFHLYYNSKHVAQESSVYLDPGVFFYPAKPK